MAAQGFLTTPGARYAENFRELPFKVPQRLETGFVRIKVIQSAAKEIVQRRIFVPWFDGGLDELAKIPCHQSGRVLAPQTLPPMGNGDLPQNVQVTFPSEYDTNFP